MAGTTLAVGPNKVNVSGTLTSSPAGLASISDNNGLTFAGPSLTNGTAVGQADRRLVQSLTVPAAGNVVVNLSSWTDTFGNALAFVRIKEIAVQLLPTPAAVSLLVGGATNAFVNWIVPATAQVRIRNSGNGGILYLTGLDGTGFTVTAATADQLKLTNEDAALAASVLLWLVGCSA